ncbi:methyltransferase domain-containing protein (plasmid) [Streptomyces zhihengii]|uniref:Methyltransferase domain-containing protein n=2 Tax=Streptomyces zhihengii TaxID=1818004 RepID=A0ABS2V3Y0_9ACTN|nr:methyltransferase domain-containing protein [Streptomyces zhihengii]
MQLTTGFWSFKSFAAAVELELFTQLSLQGPSTLQEVASVLELEERPTDLLLAACASLGLLEKTGDRYRNATVAEEFLVVGRPYYFGGFVRYCDQREYPAWHRVVEALRTNKPTTWDPKVQDSPFAAEDPVMMALFWEAMHSISTFTARSLGDAHDFAESRRILDVGGGSGAFTIELCRRHPHLTATVFDLPHVCGIAKGKITEAGLGDTVDTTSGNFLSDDPLPDGYDVILLSMILHDWDEETNRQILDKCYAALPPGGALIVCELELNPERTGPPAAALMGMNMLIETTGGKNYSQTEYETWLVDAGFEHPSHIPLEAAGANGALIAVKA